MAVPKKRCPDCGEVKPWTEYHARKKNPDGSMYSPVSYCKPCAHERRRIHNQQRPDLAHERRKRHWRRFRERVENDPEARQRYREAKRFHSRAWRERQRGDVIVKVRYASDRERVPAGPFLDWAHHIMDRDGITVSAFGVAYGVPDTVMRKLERGEQENVDLRTVERAIINEGSTTLMELYPGLYEGSGEHA